MDLKQPDHEIDILAEVRRVRHEISARFDHDPKRYIEHLMELQKNFKGRLITAPEQPTLPLPLPVVPAISIELPNPTSNG